MSQATSQGTSQGTSQSTSTEIRRKQLRWRCWHRGTREMDLLVGSFADRHIKSLDSAQLERLAALLRAPDPDLYGWIIGRDAPPPECDTDIMKMMQNFKFTPQSG